jgi:hypothetical protein
MASRFFIMNFGSTEGLLSDPAEAITITKSKLIDAHRSENVSYLHVRVENR